MRGRRARSCPPREGTFQDLPPLLLAMAGSQLTKERAAPRRGQGSWKVELDPTGPPLHVGTAPPSFDQVKMEERLTAHVEHVGFLLDDPGPRANLRQEIGEVVEQLRGTVRHRSIPRRPPSVSSGQPPRPRRATSGAPSASVGSARSPTSCA